MSALALVRAATDASAAAVEASACAAAPVGERRQRAAAAAAAAAAATEPGSPTAGDDALSALLHPTPVATFYAAHWERTPLLLRWADLPAGADGGGAGGGGGGGKERRAGLTAAAWRRRWAGLLSVADVRRLVEGEDLRYGADVDVTRYVGGERATYNAKACEVDAEVGGGGGGDGGGSGGDTDGGGATAGRNGGSGGSPSDDAGGGVGSGSDADGTDDGDSSSDSADDTGASSPPPPTYERAGAEAWARFTSAGCSLRLLRPQAASTPLWSLASRLEGHFRCAVGANAYLTPAGTQGFAPHFDDIDAFILQVAGAKRWRVYPPRRDGLDTLPRHSSVDFSEADLVGRPPVVDAVLYPGDVLYLPRGAVHQAVAVDAGDAAGSAAVAAGPSLHLTLSTSQRWTWADWLKASFAEAVESAAAEEVALRRTLPRGLLAVAGVAPSSVAAGAAASGGGGRSSRGGGAPAEAARDAVRARLGALLKVVARRYPLDAAVDGLASRFLTERLPPCPADVAAHAPPPPGWGDAAAGSGGEGGGEVAGAGGAKRPRGKVKDRSRKRQRLAARAAAAAAVRAAMAGGGSRLPDSDSDSDSDGDGDSDGDSDADGDGHSDGRSGGSDDSSDDDDDGDWADPADGPYGYVGPRSTVRLAAPGIARLTMDAVTGLPVLRHCVTNPRTAAADGADGAGAGADGGETSAVLAASPPGVLRVTPEEALGVDTILAAYPAAVAVRDVALEALGDRVQLVRALLEARLLVVVSA